MNRNIIAILEKYYPKNISSYDTVYNSTPESKSLSELKSKADPRWSAFINLMTEKFQSYYVSDRTDNEVGNRCVIYCYRNSYLFEIVVHVSRIGNYFFFRVKKCSVNTELVQTKEVGSIVNRAFKEGEADIRYILDCIKHIYNFDIMSEELAYTIVPHISTNSKQLGEARVFDAVFGDTDL